MPGDPLAVRGIQGADGSHDGRWLPEGVFAVGHAMQYKGFPQSPPALPRQIAGRTMKGALLHPAATPVGTGWDNPMGTDGFEFIEFAAPDPQAMGRVFVSL